MVGLIAFLVLGAAIVAFAGFAASRDQIEWRSIVALARSAGRVAAPATPSVAPVTRDAALPLPRRGEMILGQARALATSGHLHDALAVLGSIRPTDPQKADADRMSADIQRQLLALTTVPAPAPPDGEKAVKRVP
jgi:hypothetical protein